MKQGRSKSSMLNDHVHVVEKWKWFDGGIKQSKAVMVDQESSTRVQTMTEKEDLA